MFLAGYVPRMVFDMRLFRELKRRKVLHTLSLYVVGCWVALQVVEVLSDAGLPAGTMRTVLAAMSVGFPLVLVVAWFFDVSAEGVMRTPAAAEGLPALNLGDHALMAGLIAVMALNFYVLSSPPPQPDPLETGAEQRTLVVIDFEDVGVLDEDEAIGRVIASELRSELTRVAGLKVLGAETSRVIQMAGDARDQVATELGVTSILTGDVHLGDGDLELHAELIKLPVGNSIWRTEKKGDVRDGVGLQKSIVEAVLDAILPSASASPSMTHAPRIGADECRDAYDLYLRGKRANSRERKVELLREAVRIDPNCAVAWEAIAVTSVNWTVEGFAIAGDAARRALDLNESLAEAWAVLAEIAEEKGRWGESEEHFLRALYVDPTNTHANKMYSEALTARGRVRDALRYSLEAHRYEPADSQINWQVALAGIYAGEGELAAKHALNYKDLHINPGYDGWGELAEAYLVAGENAKALEIYAEHAEETVDLYRRCILAREDAALRDGLPEILEAVVERFASGDLDPHSDEVWYAIRCAMWFGPDDVAFDMLLGGDYSTEMSWFMFFHPDAGVLRQNPRFRQRVIDSGLLDYWRKWGWSDYCRPDGDSFLCD